MKPSCSISSVVVRAILHFPVMLLAGCVYVSDSSPPPSTAKANSTVETQILDRLNALDARMARLEGQSATAVSMPPLKDGKYTVQAGDTAMRIATSVGLKLVELEARNPGVDWTKLRIGQQVVIEQ